MTGPRESLHGQWSSRWMFILAAVGSAVGLGNIWRFPYVAGENGGGAFVLLYIGCVALVGVPIMMAEVAIGRRGRRSPINTMRALARDEGLSPHWKWVGWLGVAGSFLILSFYSVVAGWSIDYAVSAARGVFDGATVEVVQREWDALIASPWRLLVLHTIFIAMSVFVVARGVSGGLEVAIRYLMPLLFVLLLVMVGYAIGQGRIEEAVYYLFRPDFGALTTAGVLQALGQAFFSLSLGMCVIMVYGSYLPAGAHIPSTSIMIAGADTVVAILAGLAVFPLVFAYGLQPEGGPGLVFKSLTVAFGHMPGGAFFGMLFFVLLTVAGWTSAISLLEPIVAWQVESLGIQRLPAAVIAGLGSWLLGIGSLLSFNVAADVKMFGMTFFDLVQRLSADIMLPLGGLLIAIFAGWRMSRQSMQDELDLPDGLRLRLWLLLVRFISPVAVIIIFLNTLGVDFTG